MLEQEVLGAWMPGLSLGEAGLEQSSEGRPRLLGLFFSPREGSITGDPVPSQEVKGEGEGP